MTELEYLIVTNRVRISIAMNAVMECSAADEYGFTVGQRLKVIQILQGAEERLFRLIDDMTTGDEG